MEEYEEYEIENNGVEIQASERYLELNHYNTNKNKVQATLHFAGGNILQNQKRLWCMKFILNSMSGKSYPLALLPLIEKKDFVPWYPPTKKATDTVLSYPSGFEWDNEYFTKWSITVLKETVDVGREWCCFPILWNKGYVSTGRGLPEINGNNTIDNINNEYFWLQDSSFIVDMINRSLNVIVGSGFKINFVKEGNGYAFIIRVPYERISYTIYMNEEMKHYFNFYYNAPFDGIWIYQTNVLPVTTLGDNHADYSVYGTTSTNNNLFMWNKLVFMSSGLSINEIHIANNAQSVFLNNDPVIMSYDLIINDINEIGNVIEFSSTQKDRSLALQNSNLQPFKIYAFFVSKTGFMYPVYLNRDEMLSMTLMFY